MLLRGGKLSREIGRLFVADSRRQAVLPCFDQPTNDACDPLAGFALAENHFGEAAALAAMQIDMRVAEIGHMRLVQLAQGLFDFDLALLYLLQQFA
jgi:hypothetical protein